MPAVEGRLVDLVQRWSTRYQLQKLRCVKCALPSSRPLCLHCPKCSGALAPELPKAELEGRLRTVGKVARYYGLPLAADAVAHLLGRPPAEVAAAVAVGGGGGGDAE